MTVVNRDLGHFAKNLKVYYATLEKQTYNI